MIYRIIIPSSTAGIRLEQLVNAEGSFNYSSRFLRSSNVYVYGLIVNNDNSKYRGIYSITFEINNFTLDQLYDMLKSEDATVIKMIMDIILNAKI